MPKVIIDKEKCNNCRVCIEVCPMKCFGLANEQVVVKDSKKCIACKACEIQCPQKAIKVKEMKREQ